MALPILPIALLGGGALLLMISGKKGGTTTATTPSGTPGLPPGMPSTVPASVPGAPPVVPASLSDIAVQTPGIATTTPPASAGRPALSTTMKQAIANALRGLGVDPTTGQVTGTPTESSVEAATALASMLEANGYPEAAATVRQYAAAAAKQVPVATPAPLQELPIELSTELARALTLEGDPKRIRALVARVKASQWASNPQVLATLAALEARATSLEKEIDAVQTAAEVERVLSTPDNLPLPIPAVIPLPPAGDSPVVLSTAKTYVVKAGDNPSKVAQALTGDPLRWRELQTANPRYNFAKQFWAGMVLTLPPSWGAASSTPAVVTPSAIPAIPTPAAATSVVPSTYTVQAGDNPSKVAQQFTGSGLRWKELQAANTRYDFTKQFWAGMVLNIPASWR